jgi:hypothetical protein
MRVMAELIKTVGLCCASYYMALPSYIVMGLVFSALGGLAAVGLVVYTI